MENLHNVFISWSGDRARGVANALHQWLPLLLQSCVPWVSCSELEKGQRWAQEITAKLSEIDLGIVCLTPENLTSSWLLFEAGALSKHMRETRVCTYLIDLQPQDVPPPLGMFHHTIYSEQDTRALLHTINTAIGNTVMPDRLDKLFDFAWPQLNKSISEIPMPSLAVEAKRSVPDIVSELLDLARSNVQGSRPLSVMPDIDRVLNRLDLLEVNVALMTLGGRQIAKTAANSSKVARSLNSQGLNSAMQEHITKYVQDSWMTISSFGDKSETNSPTSKEISTPELPTDTGL